MDNQSVNDSSFDTSSIQNTTEGIVYIVFLAVNIILDLTLNLFGLIVLCGASNIQPATKVFLRSLTVSDIGLGLFYALPLLIEQIVPSLILNYPLCCFKIVGGSILFTANILSLLLLTADRYVSIVHCLRYPSLMTVTKARLLVCLPWTYSITYTAIYIALSPPRYLDKSTICSYLEGSINLIITVAIVLSSLLVILALYTRIAMIAHRHNRRIATENQMAWANPAVPIRFRTKSLLTLLMITLSLVVCWLPEVIALMVAKATNEFDALHWTFLLQFANCWFNTVIYYLRNKDIRHAAHSILSSCFTK